MKHINRLFCIAMTISERLASVRQCSDFTDHRHETKKSLFDDVFTMAISWHSRGHDIPKF